MAKQPRLLVREGDVSDIALIPGNPRRIDRIAKQCENVEEVAQNREYEAINVEYEGIPLIISSTGVDYPSTAIAIEEPARVGAEASIHVDTVGALQANIEVGDMIVATGAAKEEDTSKRYESEVYPAVPDYDALASLVDSAETNDRDVHVGPVVSDGAFYNESDEYVEGWDDAGLLAIEMEAATVFSLARRQGLRADTICTVDGNLVAGTQKGTNSDEELPEEAENNVERAIPISLGAVADPAQTTAVNPHHLAARVVTRIGVLRDRIRQVERLEMVAFGRWIENTSNLLHFSILLIIPALVAVMTLISDSVSTLSFLLFPPLASGSCALFSDPEGQYASSVKFVVALTVNALCGLVVVGFTGWTYGPTGTTLVHPSTAALAIFLAGATTWALDVEALSAFSTALLTLVTGNVNPKEYMASIFSASVVTATALTIQHEQFYERRTEYLYETIRNDGHILVPMRGETATQTAFFVARLAAAHSTGKIVLLDVLPATPADESDATPGTTADGELDADADMSVERLESYAHNLRTRLGIPVEIAVAHDDPLTTAAEAAANTNSDLVVAPYEENHGLLSDYIHGLFGGSYDTVAFRSTGETYRWRRVLVLITRPGNAAHAMIDFATRLAGKTGGASVTTCISSEVEHRPAESKLANLVETADGNIETRVARSEVTAFIASNAASYGLVMLGSSDDRSPAPRFISPPTFERIREIDCDVAVFDRGC